MAITRNADPFAEATGESDYLLEFGNRLWLEVVLGP